jgi:hypothetical protein
LIVSLSWCSAVEDPDLLQDISIIYTSLLKVIAFRESRMIIEEFTDLMQDNANFK